MNWRRIIVLMVLIIMVMSIVLPSAASMGTGPLNNEKGNKGDHEERHDRAKALESIRRAEAKLKEASSLIDSLKSSGIDIPSEILDMVENARSLLDEAWSSYNNSDYESAEEYADQAKDLLEDAIDELIDLSSERGEPMKEMSEELRELLSDAMGLLEVMQGLPEDLKVNIASYIEMVQGIVNETRYILDNLDSYDVKFVKKYIKDTEKTLEDIMDILNMAKSEVKEISGEEVEELYNETYQSYQEISNRIDELESEGYDMSIPRNLLKSVEVILAQARDKIDKGIYKAAKVMLKNADRKLELVDSFIEDIKKGVKGYDRRVSENYVTIKSNVEETRVSLSEPVVEFGGPEETLLEGRLRSLIEYIDLNDDGIPQRDEILLEIPFNEVDWNVTIDVSDPNRTVVEYSYTLDGFTVRVVYTLVANTQVLSGEAGGLKYIFSLLGGAREVKIDIYLQNYKWTSNESKLAIMNHVESHGNLTFIGTSMDGDAMRLMYSGPDFNVSMSYVTIADVNGEAFPVQFNSTASMNEIELYYSFNHFTGSLHYDPTLAMEPLIKPKEPGVTGGMLDFRILLVATLLVTVTILIIVIRRR